MKAPAGMTTFRVGKEMLMIQLSTHSAPVLQSIIQDLGILNISDIFDILSIFSIYSISSIFTIFSIS